MKLNNNLFALLLIFLFILNLFDAYATSYWVSNGHAMEINPIMNSWLLVGNKAFLFVKIFIVLLACMILWKAKKNKLAHFLVLMVFLLYLYVSAIHFNIALQVFSP